MWRCCPLTFLDRSVRPVVLAVIAPHARLDWTVDTWFIFGLVQTHPLPRTVDIMARPRARLREPRQLGPSGGPRMLSL